MGYITAFDSAGLMPLEKAVSLHFSSNCYPPVPQLMVPFAIEAINLAVDGEWETELTPPEGVSWRGQKTVSVVNAIESLCLEAFVDYVANEEDIEDANR